MLAFFCAALLGVALGFAWRAVFFLAFREPVFFLAFREAVFFLAFRGPVFFLAFREPVFFLAFREPVFFLVVRAPVFFLVVATHSSCTPAIRGSGWLDTGSAWPLPVGQRSTPSYSRAFSLSLTSRALPSRSTRRVTLSPTPTRSKA